jgi:hypothetical protein
MYARTLSFFFEKQGSRSPPPQLHFIENEAGDNRVACEGYSKYFAALAMFLHYF